MDIQAQLADGIQAAKRGDKAKAQKIFYDILEHEPKSEATWVWLSYVVETREDRQICLENVLFINPQNVYARHGLKLLRYQQQAQKRKQSTAVKVINSQPISIIRPLAYLLVTAFWAGIGLLFLLVGVADVINWGVDWSQSRTFPRYITTDQLITLAVSITLFVVGLVAVNLAWVFYRRYRIGYFVSILLALGLTLVGPFATLIVDKPNYIIAGFMAVMPALVFILTLLSQIGFVHDA